jgi:hypothetical protein
MLAQAQRCALERERAVTSSQQKIKLRDDLELNRIVSLKQAAEIRGVSMDTIRRRYPEIIQRLSPRRLGVRLRDALAIGKPAA